MSCLSEICLLCLNYKKLESEFIQDDNGLAVREQLRYCLPEITISDSKISEFICSSCCSRVRSFYEFKKTCLENYRRLMQHTELEGSSDPRAQKFSELQIQVKNQNLLMEQEIDSQLNVQEETEDSLKEHYRKIDNIDVKEEFSPEFIELQQQIYKQELLSEEEQEMNSTLNMEMEYNVSLPLEKHEEKNNRELMEEKHLNSTQVSDNEEGSTSRSSEVDNQQIVNEGNFSADADNVNAAYNNRNTDLELYYRSRNKLTPQIPQNLTEYAATLEDDRWRERYARELGSDHGAFFQRLVVAEDQSAAVIFASPTVLHYVNRGVEVDLHMDATFKVVPKKGAGSQLFVIRIHHDGTVYPVMYVLMERKTHVAFLAVLTVLRELAPQINVRSVMADYEAALREAIRVTFVGVELLGCWFHFARAVHKRAASIGLLERNADDLTRRLVKMAMVLPLLPGHLTAKGLQELREVAGNRVEYDPFFVYLEGWLPSDISVFRQPERINNTVESFHRDLLRMVSREHPNIWDFTECLQRMEHVKAVDFLRSLDAVAPPRWPRYKYQRLNQRIHNAQNILNRDGDVRWFLLHMTHTVRELENMLRAGLAYNADDDFQPQPQLELAQPQFPEQLQHIPQPQLQEQPQNIPQPQPQNIPHPPPQEPQPQQPQQHLPSLQPIAPRLRRRHLFLPYPDPQLPRPQILPPQQQHCLNSPPPLVFFRPN